MLGDQGIALLPLMDQRMLHTEWVCTTAPTWGSLAYRGPPVEQRFPGWF